ncbi:MAG: LacI family transcriptional regulator, partial [Chryseobacterium sp.]
MKDKISIKDIAKITGTSITTVSFVINGKAKEKSISEEVIKRIQKTVADLGYKPNAFARGLRTGKSKIIGFLVDDISKPFFSRIATAVDQLASSHGYKIIFSSIGGNAYRTKEILQIFHERQVDGYIIAITAGIEEDIKSLLIGRTPVVFFDRYLPEIEGDYVITDNYHSTSKATNLLLENGYKNIGFITTDSLEMQLLDRLKGYTYAIEEAGQKTCTLRLKYR